MTHTLASYSFLTLSVEAFSLGGVKWSQHLPHSLCWIPQQVCPMPSPGHHFVCTVACHSGGYPWGWIVFFNSTWALQLVFALRAKKSAWASLFSLLFSLSASKAEGDKPYANPTQTPQEMKGAPLSRGLHLELSSISSSASCSPPRSALFIFSFALYLVKFLLFVCLFVFP